MDPQLVVTTIKFVLGLAVILILGIPLLRLRGQKSVDNPPDDERQLKKDGVLDALTDLDYEYETGKLSKSDYERLRSIYVRKALNLFDDDELDELTADDQSSREADSIEDAVRQAREELQ